MKGAREKTSGRVALTLGIALLVDTLHHSVCVGFFSWLEGHVVSWKSTPGDQRKCQTRLISDGMSRGENQGQLKRGVWTLTQQKVVVSTATVSAPRL